MLESGDLAADGVLDIRNLRPLLDSSAQRRHNKLWLLLTLEAWYRRWIRGRRGAAGDEVAAAGSGISRGASLATQNPAGVALL
jgi:hypothetical protein